MIKLILKVMCLNVLSSLLISVLFYGHPDFCQSLAFITGMLIGYTCYNDYKEELKGKEVNNDSENEDQ